MLYWHHARASRSRGLFEMVNTMTETQIAKAKIGDRVKFAPLSHDAGEYCEGTVTHKLGSKIEITWDDGEVYAYGPMPGTRIFPIDK